MSRMEQANHLIGMSRANRIKRAAPFSGPKLGIWSDVYTPIIPSFYLVSVI